MVVLLFWEMYLATLIRFIVGCLLVFNYRCVAKRWGGKGGEESPLARLKQIQFALNRKHALFDVMP